MILQRPENAWCLYVLAHGAGAGMRHSFMQALSDELAIQEIATLRYEFPYMAAGGKRIDPQPVLEQAVRDACVEGAKLGLPMIAGGKSMGGRMTSNAQAHEPLPGVKGIAFVGFPLHPAKQPGVKRADHLKNVSLPMLFLQGTRDELCYLDLLKPIMPTNGTLLVIEGADHSFHVLKRSGRTDAQVLTELAATLAGWARRIIE